MAGIMAFRTSYRFWAGFQTLTASIVPFLLVMLELFDYYECGIDNIQIRKLCMIDCLQMYTFWLRLCVQDV